MDIKNTQLRNRYIFYCFNFNIYIQITKHQDNNKSQDIGCTFCITLFVKIDVLQLPPRSNVKY